MTLRTARCACGQLTATCEGDADRVVACNCTWCQRRTGSPYGLGAYYSRTRVSTSGRSHTFERPARDGRVVTNHFCPGCGSTVFWFLALSPDQVGVACGAFADPSIGPPARAVWTQHKYEWVTFPPGTELFEQGRPPPP